MKSIEIFGLTLFMAGCALWIVHAYTVFVGPGLHLWLWGWL